MPIFEQGYRRYDGPINRSSRAFAIAWGSFRPRLRWWIWLLLFFFMFWPYLVFAVMTFIALMAPAAANPGRFARVSEVVFERGPNVDMGAIVAMLNTKSGRVFWDAMNGSMMFGWPLFLTAIAAAGILAADRRTSALQLYLARPVTRRDYFLGKAMATAAFTFLVTLLPTLLLWIEAALLSNDRSYVLDTWWVPFAILGTATAYAVWVTAVVMFWSVTLSRPVFVALAAIFTFLFLLGLGGMLGRGLDNRAWLVTSPPFAVGGLTAPLFGLSTPEWLPWSSAAAVGLGVPLALLAFVWWRIRAVEVVT